MIHLDVLKTVNSMPISDLELTETDILKYALKHAFTEDAIFTSFVYSSFINEKCSNNVLLKLVFNPIQKECSVCSENKNYMFTF